MVRLSERCPRHRDLFSGPLVVQVYRTATHWILPDTLDMTLSEQGPSRQSGQDPTDRGNLLRLRPEHLVWRFRRIPSANVPCFRRRPAAPDSLCSNRSARYLAHKPRLGSSVQSGFRRELCSLAYRWRRNVARFLRPRKPASHRPKARCHVEVLPLELLQLTPVLVLSGML